MSTDTGVDPLANPKGDFQATKPSPQVQQKVLPEKQQEQQLTGVPILSSWTSAFTDVLVSPPSTKGSASCRPCDENGNGAFVLLDDAMGSELRGSPPVDNNNERNNKSAINNNTGDKMDIDHGFCDRLERELGVFLDKLRPARTQGDHRADEIFRILELSAVGTLFSDAQQQQQSEQQDGFDRVRGDKSLFVSREYRQRASFAIDHPCLHELVSTVTNTLDREFHRYNSTGSARGNDIQDSLDLDFSATSVQLALYPGDSRSGYRRHCDRQESCRREGKDAQQRSSTAEDSSSNRITRKRLVTAIYYLTDDDWDGRLDGGALRIFPPGDGTDASGMGEEEESLPSAPSPSPPHFDVVPLRNRMVFFRSDRNEHQVMPSLRRPRLAITMWFYGNIRRNKASPKKDTFIPIETAANCAESNSSTTRPIATFCKDSRDPEPLPIGVGSSPLSPLATPPSVDSTNANDGKDDSDSDGLWLPTIFVSIASYRDSETRPTLDALYTTAKNPERIYTGIVAQLVNGEKNDEAIWKGITRATHDPRFRSVGPHQVRCLRLHARDATGPCYARGLCQSLYRGEDYVLQIDSHMRFRPNWDEYLIQTVTGLSEQRRRAVEQDETNDIGIDHNDKIVLTTYPVGYTLPNNIPDETRGTYVVPWKFDNDGMLRQRGRILRRTPTTDEQAGRNGAVGAATGGAIPPRAHKQYLYAAGFNFGPASVLLDVPYDTNGLHHMFFGEELSMAVRLFTHGYDLYAPEETVCYHLWSRAHRPTKASEGEQGKTKKDEQHLREASRAKVRQQLLGDEASIGLSCGLGNARTAAAFAECLGVDFRRRAFVRDGWEHGELSVESFVGNREGNESLFPADTVEAKVTALDSNAKELIAMFLKGLRT